MFAPPSVRTFTNPADQIEPMTRYILTLVSFEDTGVSIFEKDKSKPDAEHSILWKWNVHTNDGVPILDESNDLYEFWDWTSNRTGMQRDGTPGKTRARLQALVGRDLTDEEITRFISDQANLDKLPGRRAYAIFGKGKGKNRDGEEVDKLKIQALMPLKGQQTPAEPAPAPAQKQTLIASSATPAADLPFDPPSTNTASDLAF